MKRTTIGNKRYLPVFFTMALMLAGMSGLVNAADVATSTDTAGGLQVQADNVAPAITGFEIVNAGYTTILDAQVDVNTEITVNVTIEDNNGWDDVDTIQVMCWYDGGSEGYFSGQTTGHNYRVLLYYDNTAAGGNGQTVPTTGNMDAKYSTTVDHSTVTDGTHAVTEVTANQKYKLTWKFTPSYQFKQADIPAVADGVAFANANSWNVMVNATDAAATTSQKDSGSDAYEFGIYKYTYISSASNTWNVGTVAPNANSDATAASVTTRSNDDMDLTVWINGDLTCASPSDTIPTSGSYVKILAAASAADDIAGDLTYTANLEAGEKTILANTGYGDHSAYMASNSALTTSVNFNIAVPYGTLPGTYTAVLTFQVTQVA
ncbi:MAG: hypothetical protein KKH41_07585 [Candidatus Thermoplasmatota archaeon]|nr:hypothetical protein [Euryarchaeota archaeon]MBU4031226.1 hypothetical protein [Candidatus Thermoplasmatota archaeon]MBU4143747.1 hypothetical protein [Candidatus Thermoplasmatota archaeon]MBU4592430.1 hypothetical protein [Candidatus Thermoplasmatota archaeon]